MNLFFLFSTPSKKIALFHLNRLRFKLEIEYFTLFIQNNPVLQFLDCHPHIFQLPCLVFPTSALPTNFFQLLEKIAKIPSFCRLNLFATSNKMEDSETYQKLKVLIILKLPLKENTVSFFVAEHVMSKSPLQLKCVSKVLILFQKNCHENVL